MSELTFTKAFLSNLDSKPQKYAADYIFPPQSFAPRNPYTLPKLPHPPYPLPPQPTSTAAPAPGSTASKSVTVTLKSTRNPPLNIAINDVSPEETTIQQLKEAVHKDIEGQGSTVDISKIKILYNKKPIPPSKNNLSDVLGEDAVGKTVELGVMILGGVSTPSQTPTPATSAPTTDPMEGIEKVASQPPEPAQGPHGKELLESDAFWDDLQGFLEQRLKDTTEAARLRNVFRTAWKA